MTSRKLNVGCGRNILEGWINLDKCGGVDIVADLEQCAPGSLPIESDSIDEFLLSHVLEHIRSPLPLFEELHRIASPGASMTARVPYGSSDDAWEDPTHVRPYYLDSFGYFGQPYYWRADYGYRGDWQVEEIALTMRDRSLASASLEAIAAAVRTGRNVVSEMTATLRAVKPIREASKHLRRSPKVRYLFPEERAKLPLFSILEIETSSLCNRRCPSCIRNSHPDRDAMKPWFEQAFLPTQTIERILAEARALGFSGHVCLQHFNEPLLDDRLAELGKMAKGYGFSNVFFCTNGDHLTDELAKELDGCFDEIVVALYMEEPKKSEREKLLRGMFCKTRLQFTGGVHIPVHFSPLHGTETLAAQRSHLPCHEPARRMIVDHRGDMLLCCDDMLGSFDLGNVNEQSVGDLWFGDKHREMVQRLSCADGRLPYPYCASCPR
jgi:SAM-dependent methyltransferase